MWFCFYLVRFMERARGKGQGAKGKGRRQNRTFTPLSVFAQQKLKVES
jgi:hypothetical protein